ncbi:MAG: hypothetical protein RIG77_07345 [Cyclobacteriaceae bacterium]
MPVFLELKNYDYFLQQYTKYVNPFVKTFAYCLLNNHFHFLIQVKSEKELTGAIQKDMEKPLYWHVSNGFSSFLQSYTRAVNKMADRTGPLFEPRFKRIAINNDAYFSQLITYIHRNPEKHGFVSDFRDYPYSSYHAHLSHLKTKLNRKEVLDWFGGKNEYVQFHKDQSFQPIEQEWFLE